MGRGVCEPADHHQARAAGGSRCEAARLAGCGTTWHELHGSSLLGVALSFAGAHPSETLMAKVESVVQETC